MVHRAFPDVWTVTTPPAALAARESGAVAALGRLVPAEVETDAAAEALWRIVDAADFDGRPLAEAHARVPRSADPLAALWQACTVLRELRGDAHLAVLAEYDLPWPQPHLLLAGTGRLDPQQREYRGFTEEEWRQAGDELVARGLSGAAGPALVEDIERRTDERVADTFVAVDLDELTRMLRPIAACTVAALPFPNAVGLPDPTRPSGT
jgi:hypothetical protein